LGSSSYGSKANLKLQAFTRFSLEKVFATWLPASVGSRLRRIYTERSLRVNPCAKTSSNGLISMSPIWRSRLSVASSQRNLTPEEALAARQSVEGQRRLLDKLRQLKATVRIVLELKPSSNSLSDFPDLMLEDGDRLRVPFRPATVNVIGSVYNTNSFIMQGKAFGEYPSLRFTARA